MYCKTLLYTMKEPIPTKKIQETKCEKCERIFYRKLVPNRERKKYKQGKILTKINDVKY